MPGSYEGGLRIVEHPLGRASATKQTRGNFISMPSAPSLSSGQVVRNRSNVITGTASQPASSITSHGKRPGGSFLMECMPEDLILPLMAFFHNRKYTEVTPVAANRETGIFQFAMPDAKPDHEGIVVGTYTPTAESLLALVSMADVYSIGLEQLYGHGDLGDTNNGLSIDNFVASRLTFDTSRGPENVLQCTVEGFGRAADPLADFAQASWGPGMNGRLSSQAPLVPEDFSFEVLTVNGVSKVSVYEDWIDGIRIVLGNGLAGRDALGFDEYNALAIDARPSVEVRLMMAHTAVDFITALVSSQQVAITARFTSGTNYLEFTLPYLKVAENFEPQVGAPGSDVTIEVPMMGVVDPDVSDPQCEVELRTDFDVRTNSFYNNNSLVAI